MSEESAIWQKTGKSNLLKHRGGTYYLNAKVGGRKIRESLETEKLSVALWKRDERLKELRRSTGGAAAKSIETLEDAVRHVLAGITLDPTKKPSTIAYYVDIADDIAPELRNTPIRQIRPPQLAGWWAATSARYAPQRANNILGLVKRAIKEAIKVGALLRDPSLDLKRVRIPRTKLELPTIEQFRQIVAHIRAQPHRTSTAAADFLSAMAYCGLRPGELRRLTWAHIRESEGVLVVAGGKEGAKNWEERRVPITPPMVALLEAMRGRSSGEGRLFSVSEPRVALRQACKAVGVRELRLYDLRHLFATVCAQSGVDVPTFAKWLGHKDGGKLALRTYVHTGDDHSREAATKVRFE